MGGEIRSSMRILAIDYGSKRIGLAVCDEREIIASGLCVVEREKEPDPVTAVGRLAVLEGAGKILIGMPVRADGSPGTLAHEIVRFAEALEALTGLRVERVDESYSSVQAHERLRERGWKRKKHKRHVDRMAACCILQSYLDHKGACLEGNA